MASRYGRNKRREHIRQIAELENKLLTRDADVRRESTRRMAAEDRAKNAAEVALKSLVKSQPMIEAAMREIGHELGRVMGPHFADHVAKLKAADRERRSPNLVSFDAHLPTDKFRVSYIEGRIEPLHYRIAVADF